MIPMMDGIKEYLGMMHELPDFVQINRVSVSVCLCLSVSSCVMFSIIWTMECIMSFYVTLRDLRAKLKKVRD